MYKVIAKDDLIWVVVDGEGIFWSVNSSKLDRRARMYAVGLLLALAVKYRTVISVEEGYYEMKIQAGEVAISWDYYPDTGMQTIKKLTERLEKTIALRKGDKT